MSEQLLNEVHRVLLAWPRSNGDGSPAAWQLGSVVSADGRALVLVVTDREGAMAAPEEYHLLQPGDQIKDARGYAMPLFCEIDMDGNVLGRDLTEAIQDLELQRAEDQALTEVE